MINTVRRQRVTRLSLVVGQLGNVVVEIERVWIHVRTTNRHVLAVQYLLHGHLHLLTRMSILHSEHSYSLTAPLNRSIDRSSNQSLIGILQP